MERALALRILVFVFFILIGLISSAEAKRVALVIGNSSYEHASRLENPKNDANALAAVLERLNFEVVKGIDLKQLEFEKTVRKFARTVRGADVALLFYAGHGLQVNGRNYLAPVDAKLSDEADLDFETLPLRTILKQMEREAKTNLVFLDACRDNPLARNLARSMGTRSAGVGRGLARVDSGVGTLIAFATEPGNVALDGEGNNSPFTSALLKHIETPGVDVDIMLRRVRKEVLDRTAGRQVPWSNSSLTGRFEFVGKLEVTVENKTPEDDKRITELQDELKKLKQQLANKPAPEQKPKDDKKLSALQKELAELREELKKRPATKPEPRDDKKMDAMQKELAALRQQLEKKNQTTKVVPFGGNARPEILNANVDAERLTNQAFALLEEKNYEEARRLLRKAAKQGYARAMFGLGIAYDSGQGTSKDQREAVRWYRKAADKGYVSAMFNLGIKYRKGEGVTKDAWEAVHWYRKAANKNHAKAMHSLGIIYEHGMGIPQDAREAVSWYRKAANAGFASSMHNLGNMYESGTGISRDSSEAAKWVFKALENGDSFSAEQMTGNSHEWSPKFRREVQRLMKEKGVYSGPIDGNFGPGTKRAIEALASR